MILCAVIHFTTFCTFEAQVFHSGKLIDGGAGLNGLSLSSRLFLLDLCDNILNFVICDSGYAIQILSSCWFVRCGKTGTEHESGKIFGESTVAIRCDPVIIFQELLDLW